ncbi:hypothetical protein [Salinigranum salinum]|uniref:hypothetical protein n=1 Tax=Salinigranum salinum TaxID=1364937 RepID=UPI001260649F|nr:hypothetical protein [Salinigranum salinum]
MSDSDSVAGADGAATATRVRRGLDYALLGGLVLLGVFAAIQFYLAADRTINVWVTREYRPPFKMVFNLVVLLVVGVGVSRQIRRLTASDGGDDAEATSEATTDGGSGSASVDSAGTADADAAHTDSPTAETDRGTTAAGEDADRAGDSSD